LRYVKPALFATAALLLAGAFAQPVRAEVSFDLAYSNLNDHGSWLVSAQYGRVWQPREYNREWNPYYDGHWVETDMGSAWVSDYEWGSIPYHYGTWVNDPRVGWVWIPGDVWAPSWVVFRTTPDYIGWYPVPPGFSVGVSMEFGAPSSFIYVSSRDFLAPRLRTAIIPAARTNVFINNTTVVNNIVIQNNVVINRGPDVRMIERATGQTVRQQPIEQVTRVAPFDHVSRAQLAVAPERVKQGVRAAQPVPESRPLPVSDKQARPNDQKQGRTDVSAPAPEAAPRGQHAQAPAPAIAPRGQQAQAPTPESAPRGQQAQTPTPEATPRGQHAQAPPRKAVPPTPSNQPEQRQPAHAAQPQTNDRPQTARPQPASPRPVPAAVPQPTPAKDKATPPQSQKAQPKPKPKPDESPKKDNPDKKDPSSN